MERREAQKGRRICVAIHRVRRLAVAALVWVFVSVAFVGVASVGSAAAQAQAQAPKALTCDAVGDHTYRLYRTLFGRVPDEGGLRYWVSLRRQGFTADNVAYWMMQGPESQRLFQGMNDTQFIASIYHNLLRRSPDVGGLQYWSGLIPTNGRHRVVTWITATPEFARNWPLTQSTICTKAAIHGLTEIAPGLVAGKSGQTVTVIGDREFTNFTAVNGPYTRASSVAGDVVVNANWFTAGGPYGPVVADGILVGSPDTIDRGQIIAGNPDLCPNQPLLQHRWTWEVGRDYSCAQQVVSGISLVHNGQRADAYPGIDLTTGYTNTNRSHSFIGFNKDHIIVISTKVMNASQLADYAIAIGATEGVMLDGGGSTQIKTAAGSITSDRSVPVFAVVNSEVD